MNLPAKSLTQYCDNLDLCFNAMGRRGSKETHQLLHSGSTHVNNGHKKYSFS